MPTTVVSSGQLPKSSRSIADMFLANMPALDPNVAKALKPSNMKGFIVVGAAIFLIIYFVKKVA
jgi:hypothetical protein